MTQDEELKALRAECTRLHHLDHQHRAISEEAEAKCRDLTQRLNQVVDLLKKISTQVGESRRGQCTDCLRSLGQALLCLNHSPR